MTDLGRKFPAARRAENRSAAWQQSAERLVIERYCLSWFEQTFVASKNADGFPAASRCGFGDCANHCVQPRTISAAGDNADSLAHAPILSSATRARSRGFRGSTRDIL